jgi:ABC-type Fe3+-hydroxamate transport system, periplasmic component
MPLTVKDDLGRTVTLTAGPARRIVSLSPAVTENLFALGAGGAVVGVSAADDYAADGSRRLTRVGDYGKPSYERILALRPDLVIAESATITAAEVATLDRRLKAPVFAQKSLRYADVVAHLHQLGVLTGRQSTAKKAEAAMRVLEAQAEKLTRGKKPVTVFVEVSPSPLYGAGPGSFVDDLIRRAGGVNVLKGNNPFPVVSKEYLLAAQPAHYVIATASDMGRADGAGAAKLTPPLDRLRAAREGRVHRIPADLLFRPTPRIARGLLVLARALHGGA